MLWVAFTLLAAFSQAWRNTFQKKLSGELDTMGVTLARFVFAGPLALGYLLLVSHWKNAGIPEFSWVFWAYVLFGGLAQITATHLMVQLFKQRNFAIGVGLARSEAVLAAIVGVLLFSEQLSWLAWLGVVLGGVAVFLLSGGLRMRDLSMHTIQLGVACGLAFALASLSFREASLALGTVFPVSAAWVLCCVIVFQTLVLSAYLASQSPATLRHMWQLKRKVMVVSMCSFTASLGWFTAMSIQSVPLVKTLGQVEVIFTLFISTKILGEQLKIADYAGLVLILIAAVMVMIL